MTINTDLPQGFALHYIQCTQSTNDDCLNLARQGMGDGTVVVTDEQTQGRGRGSNVWQSTPGLSLTFSLLIRPTLDEISYFTRFTALAGLALLRTFRDAYNINAQIKWPNDVLIHGEKVCGILAESVWEGSLPKIIILGMGINLGRLAVPDASSLAFPATSLETQIGYLPDQWDLVRSILSNITVLRKTIHEESFIRFWNENLAFRGEWVNLKNNKGETGRFRLIDVYSDGTLLAEDSSGIYTKIYSGEISP